MARRRKNARAVNGMLLIDKPTGITSNRVVQIVRRIFNANSAGHTGALDPLATGMLPVCLGEATKFSQLLLEADKAYQVVAKFGERTDTSDADGQVVERNSVNLTKDQVLAALPTFRGEIQQVPSMFSALKHEGKPLYEYARAGITIPRQPRDITVYSLELVEFTGDTATMNVVCSKGTYIRTIVDDLGQLLGCGAHVQHLRRTGVANYPVDQMITLADLEIAAEQGPPDELLLPMDMPAIELASCVLNDADVRCFRHGNPFTRLDADDLIRVYDQDDVFWGVAERRDGGEHWPRRVVVRD